MRIKTRCRAQKCVNKLAGYGEMLNKTGTDGASGKYMLKKVSSEVLKLIEEFPASDFSEDTQETLDSLRALFSENVLQNLDEMQGLLDELRGEVERSKKVTASYRILFLPYKYSMWDSLESIHEAAMEDPECESLVMPIPYYDRDSHGNLAELHDESGLYPAELGILSWKDNTVEEIDPDIIYIHNPYDEGNRLTSIHPDYYTSRLTGDDRLVIYVPYYVSYTDDPDIFTSLGFAGIYADYVITQSDWYEKEYERLLDEYRMQSEANRRVIDYYDNGNKFSVLGNPKYDKVVSLTEDDYPLPDDWHDALFCGSRHRLTVLLDTTVELLIKHKEHVFKKINDIIDYVSGNADMALIWRPHPLLGITIGEMEPELEESYRKTAERLKSLENCILDDTPDMHRAMAWSDAFLGKYGSMLELYRHTGKPAAMLDFEGTDLRTAGDYDEEKLSRMVRSGKVLREEELGMGNLLDFFRRYRYVPSDFKKGETYGKRILDFSKDAFVRKTSK